MESSTIGADSTRTDTHADNPSQAVVTAVADAKGVDPIDLPPLFGAIDPDALDALFESGAVASRQSGSVEFAYAGYLVEVAADGTVDLDVLLE